MCWTNYVQLFFSLTLLIKLKKSSSPPISMQEIALLYSLCLTGCLSGLVSEFQNLAPPGFASAVPLIALVLKGLIWELTEEVCLQQWLCDHHGEEIDAHKSDWIYSLALCAANVVLISEKQTFQWSDTAHYQAFNIRKKYENYKNLNTHISTQFTISKLVLLLDSQIF